jgi:Secretion system C-terminal sorting domain
MKTLNYYLDLFNLRTFPVAGNNRVSYFNSFRKIAFTFRFMILMAATSLAATTYTSNVSTGSFNSASSWAISGTGGLPEYYIVQPGDTIIIDVDQNSSSIQTIDIKGVLECRAKMDISNSGIVSVFTTGRFIFTSGQIKIKGKGPKEIKSSWDGTTDGGADWQDPDESWQSNGALPITLTSFNAIKVGSAVLLIWETASEQENDFFTVERSFDGIQFLPIAYVQGAGNSTTVTNYSFQDDAPASGINFYRLKQTDFDKETSYSQIEVVDFKLSNSVEIKVYPNPTNDNLHVTGVETRRGAFAIQIINSTGSLIKAVNSADNSDNLDISIDVSGLAPGVYFLVTSDLYKSSQNQFVVRH